MPPSTPEPAEPTPPLSVVLVEFSPSGGLFQFAFQLGDALAAAGHDVHLLTGPRPELSSQRPGLRLHPVLPTWHPTQGLDDPPLRRKLRRVVRAVRYHAAWGVTVRQLSRLRPDVVQFSAGRFPVDGLVASLLARRRSRPVLVQLAHAPVPFNEQRATGEVFRLNRVLARSLSAGYRSVDALLVLGERTAADLRAVWPDVTEVHVVPHGDEGVFASSAPTRASSGTTILFFGTMQAYKGLDTLLDAFSLVRTRRPSARLVIAGAPSGDTDLPGLRRRAAAIGGTEVRAGYVPMPDVAPLFSAARVVVAPYRYANASGVVALAQTFARPVVATTVGDLPAVVEDGATGLLVPPESPEALADALERLLDDDQLADRMGDAALHRSQSTAAWPLVAERVVAVYRGALARRPAGRPAAATTSGDGSTGAATLSGDGEQRPPAAP